MSTGSYGVESCILNFCFSSNNNEKRCLQPSTLFLFLLRRHARLAWAALCLSC